MISPIHSSSPTYQWQLVNATGPTPMDPLQLVDIYDLVNSIPPPIVVTTAVGEVEAANQAILDYFGKTSEQLKSWAFGDWIHPDDLPRAIAKWKQALETGLPFENESRHRRHDGAFRWVQVRVFPLRDTEGRVGRWLLLQTDIHDRRRAEEAVAASERRLEQIVNSIPAPAWSARPDGSADFFNKHYLDYVGLTLEQVVDWGWIAAVHPDDLTAWIDMWTLPFLATTTRPFRTQGPYDGVSAAISSTLALSTA